MGTTTERLIGSAYSRDCSTSG